MKAMLEIKSCKLCPNKKEANHWSSDGWDRMCDWVCSAKEDRKIAGSVEWFDESQISIPEWCPILEKGENNE